jgi:flavin-dependent dehydrogenase
MNRYDTEVIVVGGGPGGSATATLLARAGHDVLLLDKAQFPRHKACSEYVNPGGVRVLREMGLESELMAAGAHRLDKMWVHVPGGPRFPVDFDRAVPGEAALGLSRHRLDHLLLECAAASGASVRQRAHVRSVLAEQDRLVGVEATVGESRETIRAPLVIGADGRHSVIVRSLDIGRPCRWLRRTGLAAHYRGVGELGGAWGEMHVGPNGYVGLAPLEGDLTNVAIVADANSVAGRAGSLESFFEHRLAQLPSVASKLEGAVRVGGIRGVGQMAHRARRVCGHGYLLVGDAASFLDPFTGDGIYEALRAAQLAAPVASAALRSGDTSAHALDAYRRNRRRVFTAKRGVCWVIQGFIHAPPLLDYAAARLVQREDLAIALTGVLGNQRPARTALSPVFLARLLRP